MGNFRANNDDFGRLPDVNIRRRIINRRTHATELAVVVQPDRGGQIVWKHDLFNMIGEVSRNVIPAGQSDLAQFTFDIPYWIKSPLSVSAVLRYRKLNNRYARWALKDLYQEPPVTDLARMYLSIPIRDQREAIPGG